MSKSQEHVLRIAATLTLFENPQALDVTLATIKTAIQLVNFYLSEHLFIRSSGGDSDEAILLDWLYKKYPDGLFQRNFIMQNGLKKFRKASVLDMLLAKLQELGYIKEAFKGSFRLNPLNSNTHEERAAA